MSVVCTLVQDTDHPRSTAPFAYHGSMTDKGRSFQVVCLKGICYETPEREVL